MNLEKSKKKALDAQAVDIKALDIKILDVRTLDFKTLNNKELVTQTKKLVSNERKCTADVLRYLQVIYDRRIHLEMGYPSIFEFTVKELGYSHPSAQRRVGALRLAQELPMLTEKVESGELSLGAIAKLNSFFYAEKKVGNEIKLEDKKRLLDKVVEATNPRETEKLLAFMSTAPILKSEKVRAVSNEETMLQVYLKEEAYQKLQKAKDLFKVSSHADLIEAMLDFCLKHKDPVEKAKRAEERKQRDAISHEDLQNVFVEHKERQSAAGTNTVAKTTQKATPSKEGNITKCRSRYISAAVRHRVWLRDKNRCTYMDKNTGRQCEAIRNLELDHIQAFALRGKHTADNLRLLCSSHNKYLAIREFGMDHMSGFFKWNSKEKPS